MFSNSAAAPGTKIRLLPESQTGVQTTSRGARRGEMIGALQVETADERPGDMFQVLVDGEIIAVRRDQLERA